MQALIGNKLPVRTFTLPEVTRTLCGMKKAHERPIYRTRWQNFRALIGSEKGAITEAARRLGKLQGQVSHFGGKRPIKNIGDELAEQIEAAWNLSPGFLDLSDSGEGTSNKRLSDSGTASHIRVEDFGMLAEAEKWVRFEEKGVGKLQPMRRTQRLMALFQEIQADGGALSPEHAAEIINGVRQKGAGDGRAVQRGDT